MQIISIIFNDADRAGDKASFAGVKVEKNKSGDSNCVFLYNDVWFILSKK
jgi:hypothetical protein